MRFLLTHPTAILLALLLAASLAVWARPTVLLAQTEPPIDLEAMIPKQVGIWLMDTTPVPVVVSESAKATLRRIYSQTLSRAYIGPNGYRIMLAVAYGSEQDDGLKAHRPEICYPAQGFELLKKLRGSIVAAGNEIPVTRIVAEKEARVEPVTYWFVVGNYATATDLQRKFIQLKYSLTGTIPDGMLVRISSIDRNASHAFALHDEFAK